jgi:hypothetical protein
VGRAVVIPLALVIIGVGASTAAGQDARTAVDAFVSRLSDVQIGDLVIEQSLTLYQPDGQRHAAAGDQRVFFKLPQRQRVEETVEGQREIQVSLGDRAWVRRADGSVREVSSGRRVSALSPLLFPFGRSGAALLAEWRARGVRDDVSHVARIGGRPVTVIGARAGDRDVPAVWLDPEHGVIRIVTRERLPNGAKLFDLTLSEHRPLVGRFYFPYRQEAFVDGKLVVLFTVRSVAVNTNPAEALFDPASLKTP